MKQKWVQLLAPWCASLIIDQWPIPKWLRQRLRKHPEVARAIADVERLETRLRGVSSAPVSTLDRQLAPIASTHRHRRIVACALAMATVILVSVGLWRFSIRGSLGSPSVETVASTDAEPVLASLSAGQTVARKVSSGFQNVATELANAGNKLTAPLKGRFLDDPSPPPQSAKD